MLVRPALIDPAKHPALYGDLAEDARGIARLAIRDPATKTLVPAEGIEVAEIDLFWCRRLACGDAVRSPAAGEEGAEQ